MSLSFADVDVTQLTSIDDIKAAAAWLQCEEARITNDLENVLDRQTQLDAQVGALHKQLSNLQAAHKDGEKLSATMSHTCDLAEKVSSKVRLLDLAKSRVQEAMKRVDDVLDLRSCVDGVQTAMEREDYEQSAAHIHRYLTLDENVLKETAVDAAEGSGIGGAFALLRDAEKRLKQIVTEKFDQAVEMADNSKVERFLKIFPLLNMHFEGLEKFSAYLRTQISLSAYAHLREASQVTGDREGVVYADTLTLLFEDIARLVERHQPLVETFYGPGKMLPLVKALQVECDVQVVKVTDQFKEQRHLDKKIYDIRASFSPRAVSRLDPRELDILLSEMTMCTARAELYMRFLRRRLSSDLDVLAQEGGVSDVTTIVEKVIQDSQTSHTMQELTGYYIVMEEYFMRESVMKAVRMDEKVESVHGGYTSSMVDDVFFIVQKSVRRTISSGSVDGICAMLNHATTLLVEDYRGVLQDNLKQGFPTGSIDLSGMLQGKLQMTASEAAAAKTAYLVTLNNIEASMENIQKLKDDFDFECSKLLSQRGEQAKAKFDTCLADLVAAATTYKDQLSSGLSELSAVAVVPQLKPMVDGFLSVSHNITDDDFSHYEAQDPFVQELITGLQSLLDTFKGVLGPSNYDKLVSLMADTLTSQLERVVLKSSFNQLGGLQFDKELRSLVAYLSNITQWTVRDKFAKLTQMATVLNLERVGEILEYWGPKSGPLTWRLTPSEVRKVLALRVDFRKEDIDRLKL
ncbi:conserved oligomeric Golgi complex subunit 4-like [Corticium candelabrum]|uniref:conserved oligomeric Golgi complex subunit 4-like n=1 Tax=Corticium candelabrum TaxID=121492 RepID=UPI002E2664EC|nr:conserved oligomeric Golgi complex subunit 4-like [Corticium candelabrum]